MNLLNLCEPEYLAQAKAAFGLIEPLYMGAIEASKGNSLLFMTVGILGAFIMVPFGLIGLGWIIHPIVGVLAVLLLIGLTAAGAEKHRLKREGKWTAQDETNERLDEMDWNNIIMNQKTQELLRELVKNTAKR